MKEPNAPVCWFKSKDFAVTFERGYGKIFYFQPGHETYPTYMIPVVQSIIKNTVFWAARTNKRLSHESPEPSPSPEKRVG